MLLKKESADFKSICIEPARDYLSDQLQSRCADISHVAKLPFSLGTVVLMVAVNRPVLPHLNLFRQGLLATHAYLQLAHASDSKRNHTWELPSTTTVLYHESLSCFSGAAQCYVPCLRAAFGNH